MVSAFAPHWLLDRSPLARAVTGYIAAYWGARALVQFLYFDRSEAPPAAFYKMAEVALVGLCRRNLAADRYSRGIGAAILVLDDDAGTRSCLRLTFNVRFASAEVSESESIRGRCVAPFQSRDCLIDTLKGDFNDSRRLPPAADKF